MSNCVLTCLPLIQVSAELFSLLMVRMATASHPMSDRCRELQQSACEDASRCDGMISCVRCWPDMQSCVIQTMSWSLCGVQWYLKRLECHRNNILITY